MSNTFPKIEDKETLETGSVLAPRFNNDGLITAVVQDHVSGEILMLAHMNALALNKTLETGKSHFWSRSRQKLWLKGETSGNVQQVREIYIDCDQDAVILKVDVSGNPSCHTGATSCFYRKIDFHDNHPRLTRAEST